MRNQLAEQVVENIKNKYDYFEDDEVDAIYNMAISDYLALKYPSDNGRPTVDELVVDFFIAQWLYKRMIDIIERTGMSNLVSYSENGLKLEYASGNIDSVLVTQIMPKAGVPR